MTRHVSSGILDDMATKDYSDNNGTDKLIVSQNSPLFDVLEYQSDAHENVLWLLETLVSYRGHVEEAIERAVKRAREEGKSWSDIAQWLDVSKQAAWERYGSLG